MTRWSSLVRIEAPLAAALSLPEARAQLRLDDGDTTQDAVVQGAIDAAIDYLDGASGILGRCLVHQRWRMTLDAFPVFAHWATSRGRRSDDIIIPLPPIIAVDAVAYIDQDGTSQLLDPALYHVTPGVPALLRPAYGACWPGARCQPDAVTIEFTAGYPSDGASPPDWTANVPAGAQQAIRLLVAHWFENREAVVVGTLPPQPMALAVESLTSRLIVTL